jgi:nicotinamide-nucleotide amidase
MLKELMLAPPRLTLAVAESVTGGRVQARVVAIAGASEFFLGGITAYTLPQKVRHLGVDGAEAEATNGVSPNIARQMARGACALFGADLAVATTGYAEPSAEHHIAHPCAYWAICHRRPENVEVWREGFVELPSCARSEAQEKIATLAGEELLAYLRDWRSAGRPD